MQLTTSFTILLGQFAAVFTAPSHVTFLALVTGWILTSRPRSITECIRSADATHTKHFSCFHRFFSQAQWSIDQFSETLTRLAIITFALTGPIELALDDTLCRKRGLCLFGAGMHYDPLRSSRARPATSWGHDWVVISLLVRGLPWSESKVWALPLVCSLYRNLQGNPKKDKSAKREHADRPVGHKTRPELGLELIQRIASWFPDRQIRVCADSLYGGHSVLRHLPANVDLISKVDAKAALYEPAPARQAGQKGRPRKKGERISGMAEWAEDASEPWSEMEFDQFGLHTKLQVKTRKCLYYTAGADRLLTVVLTRDMEGDRPDTMYFCTDLTMETQAILSAYSRRWAIEVTFRDTKQLLGCEEPRNRTEKAVRRTTPMGMGLYTLAVVWAQGNAEKVTYETLDWYRQKAEPSFADVLTALRRESWKERFPGVQRVDGPEETQWNQLIEFASRAA